MNKNKQLDQWCKARHGRAHKLAKYLGVSDQYISDLRQMKAGISDARWEQLLNVMEAVA